MTKTEIEHMWKVASNNPNFDTNWHDPVVERFANLIEKKIREEDREQAIAFLRQLHDSFSLASDPFGLKGKS